jgi:oxaloacetate decarboxylase gamma subunit
MQVSELMVEGLALMAYGMGFVFVFLTLLVFSTKAMSAITLKLVPEDDVAPILAPRTLTPARPVTEDAHLIAVLSAAVHRYRHDKST